MVVVLVVEDDPDFRGLMVQILHGWGHDVVEAGNVAEAMARVAERRPHTVVTDIGLPDGNGFELTQQLLALPGDMRVIVISSDSSAGNRNAALRAGAIGFLAKNELFSVGMQRLIDA
ncbi:MAG: response regulator receiver protein [Conexibacter sp.]|nr:response regulator receiver protein [Conexibacter sp.]